MAFSESFRLIAAKRLKLPVSGKAQYAEIGDDVTDTFKDNKWLGSLIDMGDVIVTPVGVAADVTVAGTADPRNSVYQNASGSSGHKLSGDAPVVAPEPVAAEPIAEPEVVSEPEAEVVEEAADEAVDYMDDPSGYTVEQVVEYANAHPEHAEMLLDAERDGKGRKSLMTSLTEIMELNA